MIFQICHFLKSQNNQKINLIFLYLRFFFWKLIFSVFLNFDNLLIFFTICYLKKKPVNEFHKIFYFTFFSFFTSFLKVFSFFVSVKNLELFKTLSAVMFCASMACFYNCVKFSTQSEWASQSSRGYLKIVDRDPK